MNANPSEIRARARLLVAADKWRDLTRMLEEDVPILIAEIERLRRELAQTKHGQLRPHSSNPAGPQAPDRARGDRQLVTLKEFAHEIGVTVACARSWRLKRKIKVVKLGRLVRVPVTEVQRLVDEGTVPIRPARSQP